MGFFNFIYKLTNILSNKKKMRIFFIIAIIFILIFCWSKGAFASTPTDAMALTNYQLQLQHSLVAYLMYLVKTNQHDTTQMNDFVTKLRSQHIYVTTAWDNGTQFVVNIYRTNNNNLNSPDDFTISGSWAVGIDQNGNLTGTEYPCMLAQFTGYTYTILQSGQHPNPSNYTYGQFYIPDACFEVRSTAIDEFLNFMNAYNELPTTYSTSDAELQAICSSGFSDMVDATNDVNDTLEDVNSSVEDVNQSVMDMIDTITDPYVNVSQQQLPESPVQDPTSDGLNNLFILIKDAFIGTPQAVSFPIPFTNQSFTIEPGFTESSMRKGGLGAMVTVVQLYWYYRIYGFIFLRYVDLLEKLKEGEFEETVGNIKKEVL